MPTLKLRRLAATNPPAAAAAAAVPDEVISEAVPDEIVSAAANAANTNNASAAVPDEVVSFSHPAAPTGGGGGRRSKNKRKLSGGLDETGAKKRSVGSSAEAATSSGDGPCVGIKNPTGCRHIAKWNLRYGELIEYKRGHGHCLVSAKDEANKQLGMWVDRQRLQYRLLQKGIPSSMTEERIEKLGEVGFVLDASHLVCAQVDDEAWNKRYGELTEYKRKHGHCFPLQRGPNKQLGMWVGTQRRQHLLFKQGKKSSMTTERIDKLEEIGVKWSGTYNKSHQTGANAPTLPRNLVRTLRRPFVIPQEG